MKAHVDQTSPSILSKIDQIHTTKMGIERIKRNLQLEIEDVVEYCQQKILDQDAYIYRQGKNWYCEIDHIRITINASSYTIITAHKMN